MPELKDFESDYWITDPPYADAVNYHELGDYFSMHGIPKLFPKSGFPEWYSGLTFCTSNQR